jgi:hypothetical protein
MKATADSISEKLSPMIDYGALNQVHSGDDPTAEQRMTVGVGNRERIATGAATRIMSLYMG